MSSGGELFEDKEMEGEFLRAYNEYLEALEQGNLSVLPFSEDEFEYVLNRLSDEDKNDEVLNLAEVAFEKHPYSLELFARYCDAFIVAGKPEKALDILGNRSDSFGECSELYFLYCRANIYLKRFADARGYFLKAVECDTDNDIEMADSACILSQDCIDAGNYEEAVYYLKKSVKIGKITNEIFSDFAYCYDRMNEPEKAVEYYNKYLDINPFNDTVWFNLGTVLARLKDYDKAIEAFEYSIALNQENSSSLFNLAVVYMNLQRYSDAEKVFEQFITIDNDILGKLGLAEAYMRLGKLNNAHNLLVAIENASSVEETEISLALATIDAIKCCHNNEMDRFMELFKTIYKAGSVWHAIILDVFPNLKYEGWFVTFVESINKKED